jgi:hypothetical protein
MGILACNCLCQGFSYKGIAEGSIILSLIKQPDTPNFDAAAHLPKQVGTLAGNITDVTISSKNECS